MISGAARQIGSSILVCPCKSTEFECLSFSLNQSAMKKSREAISHGRPNGKEQISAVLNTKEARPLNVSLFSFIRLDLGPISYIRKGRPRNGRHPASLLIAEPTTIP